MWLRWKLVNRMKTEIDSKIERYEQNTHTLKLDINLLCEYVPLIVRRYPI